MSSALIQLLARYFGPGANVVRWISLPIACVVGTCGYFIEQKLTAGKEKKRFDYLDESRIDQRMQRQLQQELGDNENGTKTESRERGRS